MAAKCSCRLQAFAHLQASQGKYHGAHSTYGPLPNNTKRRDSDGVLFFPDCPENLVRMAVFRKMVSGTSFGTGRMFQDRRKG